MRRLPRFLYGLQLPLLRKKSKPENSDFYKAAPAKRRCGFCPAFSKAGEMFPKGNGFTFFSLLRKEPKVAEGPRPSRLPENGSKLYRIVFSCCFRLSSLNQHVVRPAFSDVLNRCERVIVVQTQDRYFSKMGYCTTSSQGQAAFEKIGCTLSLLRWSFVFEVC